MASSNHNAWTLWLVAALWAGITSYMFSVNANVGANDKATIETHEEIREEIKCAEVGALKRCEELRLEVKNDLKSLQTKMDIMQKEQHKAELVQAKILAIVQGLEKRSE